jgi:hypothetical protein
MGEVLSNPVNTGDCGKISSLGRSVPIWETDGRIRRTRIMPLEGQQGVTNRGAEVMMKVIANYFCLWPGRKVPAFFFLE